MVFKNKTYIFKKELATFFVGSRKSEVTSTTFIWSTTVDTVVKWLLNTSIERHKYIHGGFPWKIPPNSEKDFVK
jgi:hypothetical protein